MKRNSGNILLLCIFMSVFILTGCSSDRKDAVPADRTVSETGDAVNPAGSNNEAQAAADNEADKQTSLEISVTPEPTKEPEAEEPQDNWYDDMLNASVKSLGNNYRLKTVLEKARSGRDVYIAALGGSVTEGAGATSYSKGYADTFGKAFAKKYGTDGGSNVHYVNAGLGGTPSALGIMRYERDVVDALGAEPDLLIIEFSVNDYQECTDGRAYEALIRNALNSNPDCAVILLFAVFKSKWNMQDVYIPAGKYYSLPMVSIKSAILLPYLEGNLSDPIFFYDEYHPKTYGHQIMSDCLMRMIDQTDQAEKDEPAEVPSEGRLEVIMSNPVMITNESAEVVEKGGFTECDKAVQSMYFSNGSAFPLNMEHTGSCSNEPLTVKAVCRTMLLDYKLSGSRDFGLCDVYIDDQFFASYNGHDDGGWNNSCVVKLIDDKEAAEHTVSFVMHEGEESKSFTVLALSYSE